MKIILLTGIFFFFGAQLYAQNQDSVVIKKYYEENTILWTGGSKYWKGIQAFSLRNLKNEPVYSQDAKLEFKQYRRNKRIYLVGLILADAMVLTAVSSKDRRTSGALLLGSLLTFSISLPVGIKSTRHLSRFIWLQNRDILLK